MRRRRLLVPLLIGAIGLLAWRLWPLPIAEPVTLATAPSAPSRPRMAPAQPAANGTTGGATPRTTTLVTAFNEEAVLRQLEPLSVTDKPRALGLALAADSALPPHGVFAEARRALIVTLMVDVQRMSEARARAREFIAQYPSSRYLPLVQGVTGIHPRPSPSQLRDAR